ncbi:MAG TPA: alanine racemase [Candidatus Sulfotelmatobacter sp.]|nr:alanine racemase [Candidatus Sulfotelmatobacter sp.]HWI56108.1 alanine racemase [Bacillota bacterium]
MDEVSAAQLPGSAKSEPAIHVVPDAFPRSAWIEIDLQQLRRNFQLIARDKPRNLQVLSVIKDNGYGHGAQYVARAALASGTQFLALSTVHEAITLREQGVGARLLLLGDRQESELPWCVAYDLTCCFSEPEALAKLDCLAAQAGKRIPVHLKINTGMNRYGVRWDQAASLARRIAASKSLVLEGAFSHFAQSDELDKSFALLQLAHFQEALDSMTQAGVALKLRHLCNSGGFLDLPQAHFDMVRLGILPLGVFPSSVCRRIPGIAPVMTVKARIAAIQHLQPGDSVGYGMRFTAASPRRIAVLPIGYGDGFPRVRNQGCALIHGQRAPIVGGTAMDAIMVDITDIPAAQLWDEAVLMGRQGLEEITVHDIAKLKNSVSYDVLTGWRARLPRVYLYQDAL